MKGEKQLGEVSKVYGVGENKVMLTKEGFQKDVVRLVSYGDALEAIGVLVKDLGHSHYEPHLIGPKGLGDKESEP